MPRLYSGILAKMIATCAVRSTLLPILVNASGEGILPAATDAVMTGRSQLSSTDGGMAIIARMAIKHTAVK